MKMPEMKAQHIEFLFMDESGDLGERGSAYFTVIVALVHNPKEFNRIIKRARERKLKTKLRVLNEIKAHRSSERIRRYVLSEITKTDCSILALVIQKKRMKNSLFNDKDRTYNYFCGLLLEQMSLNADIIDITIDKRSGNRLLMEDFNGYIEQKIKEKVKNITIRIRHIESHASNALQVVDFIAWSVHRKFTIGDDSYYVLIKNKIKNSGKEEVLGENMR
jgi:hypothetical protein